MILNSFLCLASVCVVKVDGAPYLCKTDEIGEICVNSVATGTAYYGLLGITKNTFEVRIPFLIFILKSNPMSVDGHKCSGGSGGPRGVIHTLHRLSWLRPVRRYR
jgi:hypothetical protein